MEQSNTVLETKGVPEVTLFADLRPEDKVTVILATVRQPVSKEMALEFAGIDVTELTDDEREAVQNALGQATLKDGPMDRYQRAEGEDLIVKMRIDPKEPNKLIADHLMRKLGLDF